MATQKVLNLPIWSEFSYVTGGGAEGVGKA